MKFFNLFRKKVKKERQLTPEEKIAIEDARKEAKKWLQILENVVAYDGTGKGQKHFG